MSIERLKWDSQFFGIEIGRTNYGHLSTVSEDEVKKYDLLYLIEKKPIREDMRLLGRNNLFVDCKLVYSKQISNIKYSVNSSIKKYNGSCMLNEQLYSLAYLSGKYSRYKLDKNFALGKFEEMYRAWVDNSISGVMADYVFYIESNGKVCAFVTLKITHEEGVIGLIATDNYNQGKGLGRSLILKCEEVLLSKGIGRLNVATQASNQIACMFYEKCGMSVAEKTFIYHSWKS